MSEKRVRRLLWLLILLTFLLLLQVTAGFAQVRTPSGTRIPGPTWTPTPTLTATPVPTATRTPTPTPDPDPCSHCPSLDSFSCQLWPDPCYQCWADCGQPQATPTPTRTATPTVTPTPTATPTPVGPPCTLHVVGPGRIFLTAIWAHEWPVKGKRWTYTSETIDVAPGPQQVNPRYVEGYPIGYEWWDATSGELLKSCGDTDRKYVGSASIFSDGFESGTTEEWSSVVN